MTTLLDKIRKKKRIPYKKMGYDPEGGCIFAPYPYQKILAVAERIGTISHKDIVEIRDYLCEPEKKYIFILNRDALRTLSDLDVDYQEWSPQECLKVPSIILRIKFGGLARSIFKEKSHKVYLVSK